MAIEIECQSCEDGVVLFEPGEDERLPMQEDCLVCGATWELTANRLMTVGDAA